MRSADKLQILLSGTPPPANSVLPVISGSPTVGQLLSTTDGTWSGSPTFTYQWKRDSVSIGGATTNTYTLVAADAGAVITVTVTATNAGGITSATSVGVGPVAHTYASYVASLSPLLWEEYIETSGTTIINHGSLGAAQDGTWTPGTGALAQTGQLGAGQAASWDGLDTRVVVPATASLDGISKYTFAFLCKPATLGESAGGIFYSFGNSSTEGNLIATNSVRCFQQSTVSAQSLTSGITFITLGSWQWIFFQYDDTTDRKLHIFKGIGGAVTEAAYTTQTAATGTLVNTGQPLYIGNRALIDRTWSGLFDEVVMFNSILSSDQMLQLTLLAGL